MQPLIASDVSTSPFIPLAVALIALGAAFREWRRMRRVRASLRWPVVRGTVLEARFDESEWHEDGDEGTTWSAHLHYQYCVGGRRYLSRRLTWWPTRGMDQGQAYALLHGIQRGSVVDVHYDPQCPEQAVVFPHIHAQNPRTLVFWLLVAACALAWGLFAA